MDRALVSDLRRPPQRRPLIPHQRRRPGDRSRGELL